MWPAARWLQRSLLDPADGLDLARLRMGAPLSHVLVLAPTAVALQEVLEAPVPRVLGADPPMTEQRAAAAQGWQHPVLQAPGRVLAAASASSAPVCVSGGGCEPLRYSRARADKEGAHCAAAPAQGRQRGAVVTQLHPPALEVLILEEHQPAVPVVLPPRGARHWHGCSAQSPGQ